MVMIMSVKDKYVDVRYHMNTGKAHYVVRNTKIAHLSLKENWRFLFRRARHYDRIKEYYQNCTYDGKYRMEC